MRIFFILLLLVFSCSVQDTVSIVEYTKPVVEEIRYDGKDIHFKILSYVSTTDISNYNIFVSANRDELVSSEEENKEKLNEYLKLSEMKSFLTNTQRVSFKSGYQDVIFSDAMNNYPNDDTLYFAFSCWGYQAAIARVYNNNGWIQSPYSEIITFHRSQFTNLSLTNINYDSRFSGFIFKKAGLTVVNENSPTPINSANYANDFYFTVATIDGNPQMMFFTGARSSSQIQPLGYMTRNQFEQQIFLPTDSYLSSGEGVLVKAGMAYALKNTTDNIYMKIFVVSMNKDSVVVNGEEVDANVLFFYNTTEGKNKF